MNNYHTHNFVISIPTAEKRRNHLSRQFQSHHIPFRFFDAFTPSERLTHYLQQHLPHVLNSPALTMGEKGCLAGHFALWKKCIDENLSYITLFEDDILLGQQAAHFLSQDAWLKERFDFNEKFILRLETFLMPVEVENKNEISPFSQHHFTLLKSTHFGTAGYIISKAAASYLIYFFSHLPAEELKPIDEIIFNRLLNMQDYYVYQLTPAICVQELQLNQGDSLLNSDLEAERKRHKYKPKKSLKQRLTRLKENVIRALNKKKWEEEKRRKALKGKEIIPFT